jgi:hypothetical protein
VRRHSDYIGSGLRGEGRSTRPEGGIKGGQADGWGAGMLHATSISEKAAQEKHGRYRNTMLRQRYEAERDSSMRGESGESGESRESVMRYIVTWEERVCEQWVEHCTGLGQPQHRQ